MKKVTIFLKKEVKKLVCFFCSMSDKRGCTELELKFGKKYIYTEELFGDNMKYFNKLKIISLSVIFLFIGTCGIPLASSQTISVTGIIDGQILFAPMDSTTTYLIDNSGAVNHTWGSDFLPGEAVKWLGNGTILRTIKTVINGYGGAGGGVQKVSWDGTIEWDFRYDTNGNLSHHDVMPLPNGNVLMIAWETKTHDEAIAAGRNPHYVSSQGFLPDEIIEVKPTGPTSGAIVWEWHVWDHLVQDYDYTKANYGVVGDHPELVDVNYGTDFYSLIDWMHTNSIDYNEQFDQILISVHNFNEIWVIDHSTTTEEAAGHTGGRSGHGGDLLYRWGNPATYRAGTDEDEKLFHQHDATWIKSGCPGAGDILVFNNGENRPDGYYSTVDEITPPIDENGSYYLAPGFAYGPEDLTWRYMGTPPSSFYAVGISGAERIKDGGTLICNGVEGKFFEVTPKGTTVWDYVNSYPTPSLNHVFKIVYIPPPAPEVPKLHCSGSLSFTRVEPGATVYGSFQVQNIGGANSKLSWKVNTSSIQWGTWTFTPVSGENLTPSDGPVTIQVSLVVPDKDNSKFEGNIRVENQQNPKDFDIIPVYLKTLVNNDYRTKNIFYKIINWINLFLNKIYNLLSTQVSSTL
ncbi:MAG TPA: aryl-sulfate sulfotransferase [Candidatus Thermoplasmatota archaeon]|nr:aryl-sulfate sulfotransferase [Candidatus Thermoplasmatota archaeon]